MSKNLAIINKKEGETPLEALESFRKKKKIPLTTPITYAGRLDPMASGFLILLVGEKAKEKEKYLKLSKEYKFEVLFGFSTDTYDILGKVIKSQDLEWSSSVLRTKIKQEIKFFLGSFKQKYPMYSSRTVKGKPLFKYAREGESVDIPEKEISVKNLNVVKLSRISRQALRKNICQRIFKVKGDFRQKEILDTWRIAIRNSKAKYFWKVSFFIEISSGGYVRGIAHSLGERMNVPSIAFSIKRTKIGKWCKTDHVV